MKLTLPLIAALAACVSLVNPARAASSLPAVTTQPDPPADVAPYFVADTDPRWTDANWSAEDIAALRQKVKYVFVIFNENRSFDHEYGTLPGVNGLYSDGKNRAQPRRHAGLHPELSRRQHRADRHRPAIPRRSGAERDHSRTRPTIPIPASPPNSTSRTASRKWTSSRPTSGIDTRHTGSAKGESDGHAVRPPRDGAYRLRHDPVLLALRQPLHDLRQYFRHRGHALHPERHRDDRRAVGRDPMGEAPGAAGELRPTTASPVRISGTINGKTYSGSATTQGPPLVNDPQPWWGSEFDRHVDRPRADRDGQERNLAIPATSLRTSLSPPLPLTMMAGWINWFTSQDRNPAFDLADIQKDIPFIAKLGGEPVQWRWYQNGYDHEPTDDGRRRPRTTNYVSHHNGPQYFGYICQQSGRADQHARAKAISSPTSRTNALPATAASSISAAATTTSNTRGRPPIIQNPNYPNPEGLTTAEIAHDQRRQVRRRRSSELFRQPAHRGDGRPRHQRHRCQQGRYGAERDHHHL